MFPFAPKCFVIIANFYTTVNCADTNIMFKINKYSLIIISQVFNQLFSHHFNFTINSTYSFLFFIYFFSFKVVVYTDKTYSRYI